MANTPKKASVPFLIVVRLWPMEKRRIKSTGTFGGGSIESPGLRLGLLTPGASYGPPFASFTAKRSTAMIKDPVCGMEVDPETATAKTMYDGDRYYFCSESC